MSTFTDQIVADGRDVLCNEAEFGVKIKHTQRHGSTVWRKGVVQYEPSRIDEDDHSGRRVVWPARFFLTTAAGQGFADPDWGDKLEVAGNDKVYMVNPSESNRVGDVMMVLAEAYSDERFVRAGELRRRGG